MTVLGEDDIIRYNMEVSHSTHDLGVGVGIVERSVAVGKRRWGAECGVGCAQMLDAVTTFVVGWGVCDGHVLLDDGDISLPDV